MVKGGAQPTASSELKGKGREGGYLPTMKLIPFNQVIAGEGRGESGKTFKIKDEILFLPFFSTPHIL